MDPSKDAAPLQLVDQATSLLAARHGPITEEHRDGGRTTDLFFTRDDMGQRGRVYVEVKDLDETIAAIKGVPVVMPVRNTFYGAKEIGIKDPAGHIIIFAQLGAAPQH